jgi:hypothetical protein
VENLPRRRYIFVGRMIQPAQFYKGVTLHVGVPLALGITFGFARAGTMAHLFPKPVSIVYWCTLLLVLWSLMEVCSRAVERMLRPWRPPLWLIVLPGAILQTSLGGFYIEAHQRFFMGFLPSPSDFKPIHIELSSLLHFHRLLLLNAGPIALWVGINYFFDRLVDFPRFRYPPAQVPSVPSPAMATSSSPPPSPDPALTPAPPSAAPTTPAAAPVAIATGYLHSRVPENLKGEILAISALDHYLHVLTEKGSAIVHGRFVDAVSEMPVGCGWQVHRSHWVHRSAIRRLLVEQQRYSIERVDGTVVPVSSRYVEVLKMAGFKAHAASVRKT